MKTVISPREKRTAAWITLGALIAVTAYSASRIVGPYVEALLAGGVMATLFYPLHARLHKHIHRGSLAALASTVIVIITILLPLAFAATTLVRELRQAYQDLDPGTLGGGADQLLQMLDRWMARVGVAPGTLEQLARARLQDWGTGLLRGTLSAAGAATGGILQLIVGIGAFHFSLLNGPWLHRQTLLHSPLGRARTVTLVDTVHNMIRASFYGVVAVAGAQGILLGLGAWIAGLPIPGLWGLATMAVSVLPLVGSALVWIPGTIFLLANGKIGMGIFFLIWSAGLVANADNIVRPMIVMASLPVSGLLVFIAILGGIQAFGLIGIFVGPVTLAVGIALLQMLREEAQDTESDG